MPIIGIDPIEVVAGLVPPPWGFDLRSEAPYLCQTSAVQFMKEGTMKIVASAFPIRQRRMVQCSDYLKDAADSREG